MARQREGESSLETLREDLWVCCAGEPRIWRWMWTQKLSVLLGWKNKSRHVQKLNDGPGGATANREQSQRQNLNVTDFF